MSRLREIPVPAPPELDSAAAQRRLRNLSRWAALTVWGQDIDIREHGTTSERLAHLEQQLDAQDLRARADAHLASLEASRERTAAHIADLARAGHGPA
jgi:hypothetical protein